MIVLKVKSIPMFFLPELAAIMLVLMFTLFRLLNVLESDILFPSCEFKFKGGTWKLPPRALLGLANCIEVLCVEPPMLDCFMLWPRLRFG